ncbi:hypothetical protein SAMN05660226_02134 [Parapedobacter luteus]|uniref:Uncharacterized protein n=1 Tax=Parapedobacter luteus TaxID=623280 RepID=A0A1T5CDZ8_9SPHI|nr:hypothetical protein SAMN05660226_02134 [Parapedobacter luteus]
MFTKSFFFTTYSEPIKGARLFIESRAPFVQKPGAFLIKAGRLFNE